jgi:hypothetical protein
MCHFGMVDFGFMMVHHSGTEITETFLGHRFTQKNTDFKRSPIMQFKLDFKMKFVYYVVKFHGKMTTW